MSNIVVLNVPHYIWFLLAVYLVCVTLLRLAAVAEWIHDILTPQKQNQSYLTHVSTDHPEKMQA